MVKEGRTGFDITSRVDDTSSSTSGSNINADIMVHMRVQVVVRTFPVIRSLSCLLLMKDCTYSIDAWREGFLKFWRKGSD